MLFLLAILLLSSVFAITTYDSTTWPTDSQSVSDAFGPRLKESDNYRYDFHKGIDIPGELGDPVYAIADGEVFRTFYEPNETYPEGGNVIILRHNSDVPFELNGISYNTYYSLYMHLNEILVKDPIAGKPSTYQKISKGEKIGTIGHSGTTKFNHLHFEIRIGTTCSIDSSCSKGYDPHVNPFYFLPYKNNNTLKYSVISKYPLTILVESDAKELDFDEINVTFGKIKKQIEFSTRIGLNPDYDNDTYNKVKIVPYVFNSSSNKYQIKFIFTNIFGSAKVSVKDIWS